MTVLFRLFVPCHVWSVNERIHHMTRAKRVKTARDDTATLTRNVMRTDKLAPLTEPVHAEFLPFQNPGVMADTANHLFPCKAVLDGIVEAGLLVDDNPQWVLSQRFWPPKKSATTGISVILVRECV